MWKKKVKIKKSGYKKNLHTISAFFLCVPSLSFPYAFSFRSLSTVFYSFLIISFPHFYSFSSLSSYSHSYHSTRSPLSFSPRTISILSLDFLSISIINDNNFCITPLHIEFLLILRTFSLSLCIQSPHRISAFFPYPSWKKASL